jgi:hypothetical protein
MLASEIIAEVSAPVAGLPVYLAGSLVAEEAYGLTNAHDDADMFCASSQSLIAAVQRQLNAGYELNDRFSRVWARWLRYGFNKWHTNSIKLTSPTGIEVNMVYKLADGHATTSVSQVVESFDMGLLGSGYDLEYGTYHDFRQALFPGMDINGPLPLMPNKRSNWRLGLFSQYNGLREAGRYAKYNRYGFDMSAVKDDLVLGYQMGADYALSTGRPEKEQLGKIYETISLMIEADEIDDLLVAFKEIPYMDSLDAIMEALE